MYARDLKELVMCILANATIIPDPAMKGSTDTYSVPLDDIDNLRAFIEAYGTDKLDALSRAVASGVVTLPLEEEVNSEAVPTGREGEL